jgi:hypothetical protein
MSDCIQIALDKITEALGAAAPDHRAHVDSFSAARLRTSPRASRGAAARLVRPRGARALTPALALKPPSLAAGPTPRTVRPPLFFRRHHRMADRNYYACIRGELLHATSLREISEIYCEIRDQTGEGCSTFLPVDVKRAGTTEIIGHISYNGRIWTGPATNGLVVPCCDDGSLIYDNRLPRVAA